MNISTENQNGTGIVRLTGPLTLATIDQFRSVFWPWYVIAGCRNVVLDLGEVESIDSSGLGTLIAALKLATDKGGDIRIGNLQQRPRIVFEITRSYKVFEIFETVAQAVAASN